MRILFLSSHSEDYLGDGLLLGLRHLYGAECVDFPKAQRLYAGFSGSPDFPIYGNGFTLYGGLLENIDVDRHSIQRKIQVQYYDYVVFSDIWNQYGLFCQWRPYLNPLKTIIIDGQDTPQVYPHAGLWWRHPSRWFLPRAQKDFLYFKREWTSDSQFNLWHRCVPKGLRGLLPVCKNLRKISFSIPDSKIVKELPVKTKDFATHCVDPEVANRIPGCKTSYAFNNEAEYYADLQASRFAITTKRAGWDCLRHYEIAGNGCIPCFRDLDKKPMTCAPHGLDDGNCIIYRTAEDLLQQISRLSEMDYRRLQAGALEWVRAHSSEQMARKLLSQN